MLRTTFFDPLTGDPEGLNFDYSFHKLNELLVQLIHTQAMQRMASVSQLSFTHFSFPGEYSRFSHMLQAALLGYTAMDKFKASIELEKNTNEHFPEVFDQRMADAVVIALLLHDIGHPPFSHTFENIMRALGQNFHHEEWTNKLIKEDRQIQRLLADYVERNPMYGKPFLDEYGCSFQTMIVDLIMEKRPVITRVVDGKTFYSSIYQNAVSGTIDCDRLAFVPTDRARTEVYPGKQSYSNSQILDHMGAGLLSLDGYKHPIVIPVFDRSAIKQIAAFLRSWLLQYKNVYYPSAGCSAEAMTRPILAAFLSYAKGERNEPLTPTLTRGNQEFEKNPLFRFLSNPSTENYLTLDDRAIISVIEDISQQGYDVTLKGLARDILRHDLWSSIDLHKLALTNDDRRYLFKELQHLSVGDGNILEAGKDFVIDEKKEKYIPQEQKPTLENLHKIVWVFDDTGKPRPLHEVSATLLGAVPVKKVFIHAKNEIIVRLTQYLTEQFECGCPHLSQRIFTNNPERFERANGIGMNSARPFVT